MNIFHVEYFFIRQLLPRRLVHHSIKALTKYHSWKILSSTYLKKRNYYHKSPPSHEKTKPRAIYRRPTNYPLRLFYGCYHLN